MANLAEVREFIEYADLNKDNKIDKEEMLVVFRNVINGTAKLIWLYFIFSVFLFVIVYMTFSQYSRDFYLLRSRNNVLEIDRELLLRNANDPLFQLVEGGGGV